MADSGWLSSCASADAISPIAVKRDMWTSSDCSSCSLASVCWRSVRSRMKPVKKRCLCNVHLADRELHREGRAIAAPADHDPADADDSPLIGALVAFDIGVVALAIRRRHQHLDVLADDVRGLQPEQAFGRRTEGLHDAVLVDDDHGVGYAVENRLQMGLAGEGLFGIRRSRGTEAGQHGAAPGHADANQREGRGVDEIRSRQRAIILDEKQPDRDAENGRAQTRPPAAKRRGDQNSRHEKQKRGFAAQHRSKRELDGETRGDRRDGDTVAPNETAPRRQRQRRRRIGFSGGCGISHRKRRFGATAIALDRRRIAFMFNGLEGAPGLRETP